MGLAWSGVSDCVLAGRKSLPDAVLNDKRHILVFNPTIVLNRGKPAAEAGDAVELDGQW